MEIFLLIIVSLFLYFSFRELRKIRILLERPRSYKEKLDKDIKSFDNSVAEQKAELLNTVSSSTFESENLREEKKGILRAQIRIIQKVKKKWYKEFYKKKYPHNLSLEDYPDLKDKP